MFSRWHGLTLCFLGVKFFFSLTYSWSYAFGELLGTIYIVLQLFCWHYGEGWSIFLANMMSFLNAVFKCDCALVWPCEGLVHGDGYLMRCSLTLFNPPPQI